MEIPIQISDKEDTSVELLKRSLETALYKSEINLTIPSEYTGVRGFYADNIKIKKLAYSAIEEFDLPVVRTWYKYGQFEPYQRLRPKSLDIGTHTQDAYVPSAEKIPVTEEHLVEHFIDQDLRSIFNQDVFTFLTENYNQWQPEPYTDLYLASTDLIQVLEKTNLQSQEEFINDIGDKYNKFKDSSIDIRYQLKQNERMTDSLTHHVQKYLKPLEEALMRVEETSELTEEQASTIRQSRVVYHEHVLPWIGIEISLDKSEGPKESIRSFDKSGQDILSTDKKSWETQIKGWNTSLQEHDLKADYSTVRSTGPEIADSIKSLQDAAFKSS